METPFRRLNNHFSRSFICVLYLQRLYLNLLNYLNESGLQIYLLMKPLLSFWLLITMLFTANVHSQTFSIVSNGPSEVCAPTMVTLGIQTLPPGNWSVFEWKKLENLCSGLQSVTVTMGPSPYLYLSGTGASGLYQCVAYDGAGGVVTTTNSILVRILPQSSATLLPAPGAAGATTCVSSVQLCVKIIYPAHETMMPSVSWYRDNTVISGATSSGFLATSSGFYKYQLSTSCGVFTSDSIRVDIGAPVSSTITASGPTTFCSGGSVTLTAPSGPGYTYQWKRNGIVISGATSGSYLVNSLSGNYTCTIGSPGCATVNSNSISVTVNNSTAVSFSGLSANYSVYSPSSVLTGSPSGGTFTGSGITGNIFNPATAGSGTHTITYHYTNANGCSSTSSQVATVCAPPPTSPTITGSLTPCAGSTGISYSCSSVALATGYTWSVPSGATIVSGQGTATITVNFSTTFTNGSISVIAGNSCGNSAASYLTVYGKPNPPTGVTGQMTGVCSGSSGKIYTVNATPGATYYNWTVSSGMSIVSGQGSNQITVNYSTTFNSGTLGVSAGNSCGASIPISYTIYSKPPIPGTISGPAVFCSNQAGVVYSISPVYGATTYQWLVPSGAIIAAGQGTTSITVNFGTKSGKVQVRAGNACGYSNYRQLNVSKGCREASPGNDLDSERKISVYPNPFNDELSILHHGNQDEPFGLSVYDFSGKLVYHQQFRGVPASLDLSGLKPGVYSLLFYSSSLSERQTVVKNH